MTGERREGTLVGGRYRLTGGPGHDGFRLTWEARDELLGVRVDVQEVRPPDGLDDDGRARWREGALRRARMLVAVGRAPGAVRVYGATAEDGVLWLVTEHVAGQAADAYVDRLGPLPADRARQIAGALLAALGAMHAAGVVHGGLTPREVRIDDSGQVRLTGFHAWVTGPAEGAVIGVPGYMSPEQLEGHGPSRESDLFSLGATLYHLLRGTGPFRRDSVVATVAAVRAVDEDPPPPLHDPALAPLIGGLLRGDPARRWTLDEARRFLGPVEDEIDPPPPLLGHPAARRAQPAAPSAAPASAAPASAAPAPAPVPVASRPALASASATSRRDFVVLLVAVPAVWLLLVLLNSDGGPALLVGALPWAAFVLGVGLPAVQVRIALRRGRRARWAGRAGPAGRLLPSVAPPARWSQAERGARRARAEEAVDRELRRLDRLTAGASRHGGGDGGTGV